MISSYDAAILRRELWMRFDVITILTHPSRAGGGILTKNSLLPTEKLPGILK